MEVPTERICKVLICHVKPTHLVLLQLVSKTTWSQNQNKTKCTHAKNKKTNMRTKAKKHQNTFAADPVNQTAT